MIRYCTQKKGTDTIFVDVTRCCDVRKKGVRHYFLFLLCVTVFSLFLFFPQTLLAIDRVYDTYGDEDKISSTDGTYVDRSNGQARLDYEVDKGDGHDGAKTVSGTDSTSFTSITLDATSGSGEANEDRIQVADTTGVVAGDDVIVL